MSYPPPGGPEEITVSLGPTRRIVPVSFLGFTTTSSQQIFSGLGFLLGWSARETTGTAAFQLRISDGGDATGPAWGYPGALANGSDTNWFGPEGLPITAGVYLRGITGTCDVSVWIRRGDAPLQHT